MKFETIVVTGGIGSGKSRVLETIKNEANVKVDFFSFDEYTKELYFRTEVLDFLQVMFGTTSKEKISDIVFASEPMREALNSYFFKLVEDKFLEIINRKAHSTFVVEFPLYFEMKERSNLIKMSRSKVKVIVVACDEDVRLQRIQDRDGFVPEKIKAIMASQVDQRFKIENADYLIDTTDGHCDVHVKDLMKKKFKKVLYHATESQNA